mmetsp:Transcript_90536/g.141958  ORF Transcript_90536/g.141958 Transcript_90536/m.141958 type:complete len:313 (+) Transcript_90536:43-981(+)
MDARERQLSELPVAVLQAHAQECGIDVSTALEKRDLVQQILQAEPNALGRQDRQEPRRSQDQQAELLEDERIARQLQDEEAFNANRERQAMLRTRGGTPALLELLSQSMRNNPSARGPSRGEGELRGSGGYGGASGSARIFDLMQSVRQTRGERSNGETANLSFSPDRPGSSAERDLDDPVAAQVLMLMGQVMGNSQGRGSPENVAGIHALTELLSNLMPQQGIDSAAVNSRTATMTYSGETTPTNSPARGNQPSPASEERKCMVCLEAFQGGEELRILPCLHRYHRSCIDTWLARNRHCPVCKHDVTQEGT